MDSNPTKCWLLRAKIKGMPGDWWKYSASLSDGCISSRGKRLQFSKEIERSERIRWSLYFCLRSNCRQNPKRMNNTCADKWDSFPFIIFIYILVFLKILGKFRSEYFSESFIPLTRGLWTDLSILTSNARDILSSSCGLQENSFSLS